MKKIKYLLLTALSVLVSGLVLTSCQQDRSLTPDTPPADGEVTVRALVLVEQEDGSYREVDPSFLRGADDAYGTWAGLGKYPANTKVTVSFSSKSPWWIYSFFDKSKGESTGLTGNRTTTSKSASITVTKDVTFVAKVRKLGAKTTTATASKSKVFIGSAGGSSPVAIRLTEVTPILGKDGSKVDDLTHKGIMPKEVRVIRKPAWVTATAGKGSVMLKADKNLQPDRTTNRSRAGKVTIFADGKTVTVDVHQASRFEAPSNAMRPDEWVFKNGDSRPSAQYHYNFPVNGSSYDIKGLNRNFGTNPVSVLTAVYINGRLADKRDWVTHRASWSYGTPSQRWVTSSGRTYTAGKNVTGKDRPLSIAVIRLTLADTRTLLCESKINFTQKTAGFIVDGEVK